MPPKNRHRGQQFIVPTLSKSNPTDPASYRTVGSVKGMPLNWQDDITKQMQPAVLAFHDGEASPDELRLVIIYLQHYIHAPALLEEYPFKQYMDSETVEQLKALRERSMALTELKEVQDFLWDCLGLGIDPL